MTKIKENSTRNMNKVAQLQCPVTYVMERIGGHWKPIILYQLMTGPKRYSELKRAIPVITEKVLIQHLKQLQADDLVVRKAKNVVPPFVEYSLGASGETMKPLLHQMADWAISDNRKKARAKAKTEG
ncbi:MAG: transcriptional regulator [Chitinophagaceae bacterium]|nr:MAG: transcriptional regulator [Chitinophagaceae bacterium]